VSAAKSRSFRGRVKREAGENPARSRHCVRESVPYITALQRGKREAGVDRSQETCRTRGFLKLRNLGFWDRDMKVSLKPAFGKGFFFCVSFHWHILPFPRKSLPLIDRRSR